MVKKWETSLYPSHDFNIDVYYKNGAFMIELASTQDTPLNVTIGDFKLNIRPESRSLLIVLTPKIKEYTAAPRRIDNDSVPPQ